MPCENGFGADVMCGDAIIYEYYFIRTDNSYVFGLSSNCFEKNEIKGIKSILDADMNISSKDASCFIRSIVIENGSIVSFVDSTSTEWIIRRKSGVPPQKPAD